MAKLTTTRTLNRLPFNELDPKRFEDLVRQLIYDFRTWRQLEATGRAGSDDGYDARGWEIVADADAGEIDEEEGDEERELTFTDRRWMVQCKRETVIGPAKLLKYLEDIPAEEREALHGFIFAAACDFSKKTRDAFREWCRSAGIRECYIWGRSEVEDMLFQPKNDGLLFAYFGISLQIRQRTVKTALRARLSMKRKAKRLLSPHSDVLLRRPDDTSYPFRNGRSMERMPWRERQLKELHPQGVVVELARYIAFLDAEGKHWDAASTYNDAVHPWRAGWLSEEEQEERERIRRAIETFSEETIPKGNCGMLSVAALIPFDDIFDIDADEDDWFRGATTFVPFERWRQWPCFVELGVPPVWEDRDGRHVEILPRRELGSPPVEDRVEIFPAEYRSGPLWLGKI
jgi:hypothetical protein